LLDESRGRRDDPRRFNDSFTKANDVGQYPSPYSPPNPPTNLNYASGFPDLMAPARRASIMMFVIGAMSLLLGLCSGAVVAMAQGAQYQALAQQFAKSSQGPPPSESVLRTIYAALAIISAVAGIVLIVLGIFVRRASKVAMVFSVILCGMALLWLGISELSGLIQALGNPVVAIGACVMLVPLATVGLTTMWLIQALKALPHLEAARQQWQAQYTASRQQQAFYQGGPAYGQVQTPPPGYPQQPYGGYNPGTPPGIGYGAMPPAPQPDPNAPPVRHPPLPPDQQNTGNPPG
jgi:hypothetical protein